MLDQRSPPAPADRSKDRASTETARIRLSLLLVGLACLAACLTLLAEGTALGPYSRLGLDPVSLRLASASLAILAGAFCASAIMAELRSAGGQGVAPPFMETTEPYGPLRWKARIRAFAVRAGHRMRSIDPIRSFAVGMQALSVLFGAGMAIAILLWQWPVGEGLQPAGAVFFRRGVAALVAAFPLLLAERAYGGLADIRLPEAPSLQLLLRLALLVFLCEGIAALLEGYGFEIGRIVEPILRVLLLVVAAELGLRALAVFFQPPPEPGTARAAVASSIASLSMPGAIRGMSWQGTLQSELGIDLSRSWALQFLRAALLPALSVLALFAWGLTGVTILGADQRGIY